MKRSTFFYHLKRLKEPYKYFQERQIINDVFKENKGRYGYRRITLELNKRGFHINHKTVSMLMKQLNIKCEMRKVRYHSYKGDVGKTVPNIINRNFYSARPNRKWATDITQMSINNNKCYLSPIMDMFNGELISFSISNSPNMNMIIDMLAGAYDKVKNTNGIILHSDQGWHYQNCRYQQSLKEHGIIQSMSRKGNCLDNAMMENFFGLMKSELLYANQYHSIEHFVSELRIYIEYYNNKRIKLRLKGMSPVEYRNNYLKKHYI